MLGSLVTGTNVLMTASDKLAERSSANIDANENLLLNMYAAVSVNVKHFIETPATLLLGGFPCGCADSVVPATENPSDKPGAGRTDRISLLRSCGNTCCVVYGNHQPFHHSLLVYRKSTGCLCLCRILRIGKTV